MNKPIIKKTPELQAKFDAIMAKYEDDDSADFTDEEVQFLGDYDIGAFTMKFPDWCTYYMEYLEIEACYLNEEQWKE